MTSTSPSPAAGVLPLTGRIALVTGAASGIGAATARRLTADGARVALLARRADRLDALAAELGEGALAVAADLTDPAALAAAADRVHAELGPVDLLVNCAGVMLPAPLAEGRADEWRRMLDLNVLGLLEMTRLLLPGLRAAASAARPADVVNVSSIAAQVRFPGYAVYGATKAAVSHLSSAMRQELGPEGVRVTDVKPGGTTTELGDHVAHGPSRIQLAELFGGFELLQADDLADAVAWAASRPARVSVPEITVLPSAQPV